MGRARRHCKGRVAGGRVGVFASTADFSKGIAAAWSIIFWRGVFVILSSLLWLAMTGSGMRRGVSGSALAVAVLYAAATGAFIPAFKLTSVANVVLIWARRRCWPGRSAGGFSASA